MEYGNTQQGDLTEVTLVRIGTETDSDHLTGATVLSVYDSGDFRDEGGFLKIFIEPADPDTSTPEVSYLLEYSEKDDDTNVITLVDALPADIAEDTQVWVDPPTYEKWGSVLLDPDEDAVPALIDDSITAGVEEGIRLEPDAVLVRLEGNDYVVRGFPGKGVFIDWENVNPDTIPNPADGPGPGEAPILTGQPGLATAFLSWTVIPPDPGTTQQIYYEIHASAAPDFEAGLGTYLTSQVGHVFMADSMPNGTLLPTDVPTYFKVRAFDRNGAGPWSNEVAVTPAAGYDPAAFAQLQLDLGTAQGQIDDLNNVQLPALQSDLATLDGKFPITTVDISNDAISAPKILAGAVTTEKMIVNTISGDRILVNTLDAGRILAGSITTDRMTVNSINGDRILANTLDAFKINAHTITATQIFAGTITATEIATGAITAVKIDTGAVTADKIDTGAVTAVKLSATAIDGKTITGANIYGGVFRTDPSAAGAYVEMLSSAKAQVRFWSGMSGEINPGKIFGTITGPGSANLKIISPEGSGAGSVSSNIVLGSSTGMSYIDMMSAGGDVLVTIGGKLFVNNPTTGSAIPNARYNSSGGGEILYTSHSNSSRRYKTNILPLADVLTREMVLEPTPVRHKYKKKYHPSDRPAGYEAWGLIAEDLDEARLTNFVGYDDRGRPDEIDWAKFAAVGHQLVLREHDQEIKDLQEAVKTLTKEIRQLKKAA